MHETLKICKTFRAGNAIQQRNNVGRRRAHINQQCWSGWNRSPSPRCQRMPVSCGDKLRQFDGIAGLSKLPGRHPHPQQGFRKRLRHCAYDELDTFRFGFKTVGQFRRHRESHKIRS